MSRQSKWLKRNIMTVIPDDRISEVRDTVFVRSFGSGGQTWLPGYIQKIQRPVLYSVVLSDDHSLKDVQIIYVKEQLLMS